ncbi:hypothetical protein [Pradoshia sp.]
MNNQTRRADIAGTVKRKIAAAIVSSLLFALIISIPEGFDVNLLANLYYLNLMIVMIYGVATSMCSDWISRKVAKRTYIREIISFLFHCLFGAILVVLGLFSAILFFLVDRILIKMKFGWLSVMIALLIVMLVFIILINK